MLLGTEVGLGPGDIVLDGDPAPPRKGVQQPPLFGSCLLHLLGSCCNNVPVMCLKFPIYTPHFGVFFGI